MPQLGISRVTDITRMDRLGVPVHASVRPRGHTLRVHAGKGLVDGEARAGALMEAIEYAVCEHASSLREDEQLSVGELASQLPDGLRLVDFAPKLGMVVTPKRQIAALRCEDISGSGGVLLPAELVCMPWSDDNGPPLFGASTNGLASGNSLEEATLHGLLEVLERDAQALGKAKDMSADVEASSLPEPFATWAEQWKTRQGVDLIVRFIPNDFGLPCFEAYLHEAASTDVNLAGGAGLHVDPGIALARAVCEAAQSRLSVIHGGRDDITHFYAKYKRTNEKTRHDTEARLLALFKDRTRRMVFADVPRCQFDATAPDELLKDLLAHLASRQFGKVFRRRMDMQDRGIDLQGLHVVKIVVPRCESIENDGIRMGPRLLARVIGND